MIGANGAGKTSTMKAIAGLLPMAQGQIDYQGCAIQGMSSHLLLRQGLALVPEGRGVFARMTVLENLQMGAYIRDDASNVADDLERMFAYFPRLKERCKQLAGTLSGGEQQRLALARALAREPSILFLDEPTASLDVAQTRIVEELIARIASRGVKIIMSTHDLGQARRLAQEILFLVGGRIVEQAPAIDFFTHPQSENARQFLRGELVT